MTRSLHPRRPFSLTDFLVCILPLPFLGGHMPVVDDDEKVRCAACGIPMPWRRAL